MQRQLGLDAVVDCGDCPDLRSALRDCEWSPAFAWSKNDRVMLLQPWLMLRGTWLQPRLAVRLRRHADDIEVEIRCLGVTHWDWQSQLAKEVELAGLQLNAVHAGRGAAAALAPPPPPPPLPHRPLLRRRAAG